MPITENTPSAAILICTCDRPDLLNGLLAALSKEVHSARYETKSVVIVDNGEFPSQDVVDLHRGALPIIYQRLTESGLVVARNASLAFGLKSSPKYLLFIDDDEVPTSGWLDALVSTLEATGADLANGPVVPNLPQGAPLWAADFFAKSGENCCTSNLIVRAAAMPREERNWFNPAFNYTGGEDNELLSRLRRNGARHVVAKSANVAEFIPYSRLSIRHLLLHGLRDGIVITQKSLVQGTNLFERQIHPLGMAIQKLLFGINHLFWSLTDRSRLSRALPDFAAAVGILFRLMGGQARFYGNRPS